MIWEFEWICEELENLTGEWEPILSALPEETISLRKNSQGRSIRQILGHMVDSATNNTHRVIHMHYQESPVNYPDYANQGNNDRWIAIQNYQEEDWNRLIRLWVAVNQHFIHVIRQIEESKLEQQWTSALNETVNLREMVNDYPRHFKLHLNEISELINQ
jgi:hypothetical protein